MVNKLRCLNIEYTNVELMTCNIPRMENALDKKYKLIFSAIDSKTLEY